MNQSEEVPWWQTFHVREMADMHLQRHSPQDIDKTVGFLIDQLEVQPGETVYDQCCGSGVISFGLAERERKVVGVDLCQTYIAMASDALVSSEPEIQSRLEFHCDDAFEYETDRPVDAVFNWYSSFGYSDSDRQNERMLHRAFASLKPGGRFALDVPNFPGLIQNFQTQIVREGESLGRKVVCIRDCRLNWQKGLLEQTWNWQVEGKEVDVRKSALRLYLPHQISDMIKRVGFEEVKFLGDVDLREFETNSPRLILTARRP